MEQCSALPCQSHFIDDKSDSQQYQYKSDAVEQKFSGCFRQAEFIQPLFQPEQVDIIPVFMALPQPAQQSFPPVLSLLVLIRVQGFSQDRLELGKIQCFARLRFAETAEKEVSQVGQLGEAGRVIIAEGGSFQPVTVCETPQ